MNKFVTTCLLSAVFSASSASAEIKTTSDALKLVLADDRLEAAETLRVESAEVMQHRLNDYLVWRFELTDGEQKFRIEVADEKVESLNPSDASVKGSAAFWKELPLASEFAGAEDYLQLAKDKVGSEAEGAKIRPEYIVSYEVCTPPSDQAKAAENGCAYEDAKETWLVILRVDLEDKDDAKLRSVRYEDGDFVQIGGARVGGNW